MSQALVCALWRCAERLWEPCWPTFPANSSGREGSLRSISNAEPGSSSSLGFQQLPCAHRAAHRGLKCQGWGATRGLSPASRVTGPHWEIQDTRSSRRIPTPGTPWHFIPDPPQSTRLQQGEGATSSPGKDQTQAELLPWEFQGEKATGRGMPAPLGLCDVLAMGMRHHRTQKVSLGWRWPLPLPWEKEPLPCCVDRAWMQLDTASRTLLCCEIWLPFSHL